jgi:hypothetical protein
MKRATAVLSMLVALLVSATAFAAEVCPAPLALEAAAPAIEAPWLSTAPVAGASLGVPEPVELLPPQCDKTWCSERRFECRNDCLPCGFQFTCYVLQCSYSCQCIC